MIERIRWRKFMFGRVCFVLFKVRLNKVKEGEELFVVLDKCCEVNIGVF